MNSSFVGSRRWIASVSFEVLIPPLLVLLLGTESGKGVSNKYCTALPKKFSLVGNNSVQLFMLCDTDGS